LKKSFSRVLLYRFITVQKLIDLFENRHLVMVKPSKWIDPFENIISKVKFRGKDGISYIEYMDNVYGICFTKAKESNLMWDAYTPNGNGVRIAFEKEKLINTFKHSKYRAAQFTFKLVEYKQYSQLISQLEDNERLLRYFSAPSNELIRYLFHKRNEYRYEEEFRIIYDANIDNTEYNDVLSVPVDPTKIIDGIRLDPRMPDSDCKALTKYLVRHKIDGETIVRSQLYKKKIRKVIRLK